MSQTYDSLTDLGLGAVPMVEDQALYQELLDIHNALESLLTISDAQDGATGGDLTALTARVALLEVQVTAINLALSLLTDRVDDAEDRLTALENFPYVDVAIPETILDENSGEVTLGEIDMTGLPLGIWRFGFDLRWYIEAQGGTAHRAIFRLYLLTAGVPILYALYKREPKDVNEVDWASKGNPFNFDGTFDALRLTVEESDGASNPALVILEGGYIHVERKT